MDAARTQLKAEILRVLRDSEDALKAFRRRIADKDVVVFVGNTRDGKSTLVNHIMGAPLVAVRHDSGFRIDRDVGVEAENGPRIGHGSVSFTTEPVVVEVDDRILLDAPGFDDNRGPVQEIVNALYVNQIKYAKGVRFVLVSDVRNLVNDNINPFLSFLDTVHAIMPNARRLKQAVSVIFTKDAQSYGRDELVALLKSKILDMQALSCNKTLVEHFVRNEHLVGLFRMPTQEGPLSDVDVNVREAIFRSLPVSVSELDIKFGISKSARVVLLESYLDFFDDVLALKDTFRELFGGASENLEMSKEQLLWLTDTQLGERGLRRVYDEFCRYLKNHEASSAGQIPDTLRSLFVEELRTVTDAVRNLGVTVAPYRINEGKIEHVRQKLDHIGLIERVLETNNKSKQVVLAYREDSEDFLKKMTRTYEDLGEESLERAQLVAQIGTVPEIVTNLSLLTDDYLLASHDFELRKMSADLEQYVMASNDILVGIIKRPPLHQRLNSEINGIQQVHNSVKAKLEDIDKHLRSRDGESVVPRCPMRKLLGAIVFCMGCTFVASLSRVNQLRTVAGSLLLVAAFSWRSRTVHRVVRRYQQRYRQNRLFSSRTVVNDCWKNLFPEEYLR